MQLVLFCAENESMQQWKMLFCLQGTHAWPRCHCLRSSATSLGMSPEAAHQLFAALSARDQCWWMCMTAWACLPASPYFDRCYNTDRTWLRLFSHYALTVYFTALKYQLCCITIVCSNQNTSSNNSFVSSTRRYMSRSLPFEHDPILVIFTVTSLKFGLFCGGHCQPVIFFSVSYGTCFLVVFTR